MVIAIDGPAGSGKSTIAKLLAEKMDFTYINSGNLYRAITLGCIRAKIDISESDKVIEFAKNIKISYKKDRVSLDGEDVTDLLHTDEIDKYSSPLSSIVAVRHIVNENTVLFVENFELFGKFYHFFAVLNADFCPYTAQSYSPVKVSRVDIGKIHLFRQ